jgi:hypothetical protein
VQTLARGALVHEVAALGVEAEEKRLGVEDARTTEHADANRSHRSRHGQPELLELAPTTRASRSLGSLDAPGHVP